MIVEVAVIAVENAIAVAVNEGVGHDIAVLVVNLAIHIEG